MYIYRFRIVQMKSNVYMGAEPLWSKIEIVQRENLSIKVIIFSIWHCDVKVSFFCTNDCLFCGLLDPCPVL